MPQLRVLKNSEPFCIVGSDDVWMFSVSVWADLWGPEPSMLDISGGSKRRPDGGHDFLIWALPVELATDDIVDLYFEPGSVSVPKGEKFHRGRSNGEEGEARFQSWPPKESELREWEARPALNEGLYWSVVVNGAAPLLVGPTTRRQHVGLHTLWNEDRPDRLHVSLSTSSLREILARSGGRSLFEEYVAVASHVRITIAGPSSPTAHAVPSVERQ